MHINKFYYPIILLRISCLNLILLLLFVLQSSFMLETPPIKMDEFQAHRFHLIIIEPNFKLT